MEIGKFMRRNPITLKETDTFRRAIELFCTEKINGIPIVDEEERLAGILTASKALRLLADSVARSQPLRELMRKDVYTIDYRKDIEELIDWPVSSLPVVDGQRLVGICYLNDTIKAYYYSAVSTKRILNETINALPLGVISVDEELNVKVINSAAEEILMVHESDILGKDISNFLHEANMETVIETGEPITNKRIVYKGKHLILTAVRILAGEKEANMGLVTINDFTEWENLSRELLKTRETTEELETVIETSAGGMLVTDSAGVIARVNTALTKLFEMDRDSLIGRNVRELNGVLRCDVLELLRQDWRNKGNGMVSFFLKHGKKRLMVMANCIVGKNRAFEGAVVNIQDVSRLKELEEQLNTLKDIYSVESARKSTGYIFTSPQSEKLLEKALKVAKVDSTVLITGESGVGKEVVANVLCANSPRKDKPFVKINCGAIPEALLESELFGYDEGSFTGAKKRGKKGLFEAADGGTIFLDEISELPLALQVKLLRVLQEKELTHVGGIHPKRIDIRVIAATNQPLEEQVADGRFREDLYYRLNVVPIHIPPLRERKEDIPELAASFLKKYNEKYHLDKRLGPQAMSQLLEYGWPGNIRELENQIERAVVTANEEVIGDLRLSVGPESGSAKLGELQEGKSYKELVAECEKVILRNALDKYGSTRKAAEALGIDQSTIVKKTKKLGL